MSQYDKKIGTGHYNIILYFDIDNIVTLITLTVLLLWHWQYCYFDIDSIVALTFTVLLL